MVSSDCFFWAAYALSGYVVYIGTVSASSIVSVCHKTTSIISDIGWMPNTNELVISGGSSDHEIRYFYQYNPISHQSTNLTYLDPSSFVKNFAFSSPSEIYTLEINRSQVNNVLVRSYNFFSKEQKSYQL